MEICGRILDPRRALAPSLGEPGGDALHGPGSGVGWTKVETARMSLTLIQQAVGEQQVAPRSVEDVLPGADGFGVANQHWLAAFEAADQVGNQAVGGPVAAADDVSGACGRQRR